MDWRSLKFDWNRAKAFLVTAETGSLSAAGEELRLAQPTVGRQIAALEAELDLLLFQRVGGRLQLTEAGADLLEQVRTMGEAATRLSLIAAGKSVSLAGPVCISASQVTATFALPPLIETIQAAHPGIELEVVATNETSDLNRREADIAIRSYRPTQANLIARKVREGRARLYASPKYLRTLGRHISKEKLASGTFLGFNREDVYIKGLNALGIPVTQNNFPILTESQLVQWELAKRGVGIAVMTEEVGDCEPKVKRVLPTLPAFPVPVWLTTHQELASNRRMRVVFDLLFEGLSAVR